MSTHPANLALRFVLELAALFSLGHWGWSRNQGLLRWVLAVLLPLAAAAAWGVFSTPGDRSRSAAAVVATPGAVRLGLELLLFGGATWALVSAELRIVAVVFAGAAVLHYGLSYDRILWLLKQ